MVYKIVALLGDHIGPEITEHTIRVLYEAGEICDFKLNIEKIPCGGKYYQEYGEEYPSGTIKKCRDADAILKAPVGYTDPRTGREVYREDGEVAGRGLIELRKKFKLFAKLIPIKGYENLPLNVAGKPIYDYPAENIDFVIVRENTEGEYFGPFREYKGRGIIRRTKKVITHIVVTKPATKRIHEFAFEQAKNRHGRPLDGEKSVTCVTKSNIIKSHNFYRDIFEEVAKRYPSIKAYHEYFDAFLYKALRTPEIYDVIVTTNLLGDAITDFSGNLQGSLGIIPTANVSKKRIMCEPAHGTVREAEGLDIINPTAMIRSGAMMLPFLAEKHNDNNLIEGSNLIERSIEDVYKEGKVSTPDVDGNSTCSQFVDEIVKRMNAPLFEF